MLHILRKVISFSFYEVLVSIQYHLDCDKKICLLPRTSFLLLPAVFRWQKFPKEDAETKSKLTFFLLHRTVEVKYTHIYLERWRFIGMDGGGEVVMMSW